MLFTRLASLTAAFLLAAPVLADFHIFNCQHSYGYGDQNGEDSLAITVPSNQYSCDGARNSPIVSGTDGTDDEQWSSFSVSNLCGTNLDFYPSGGVIPFYISGGDGSVVGTCYGGSGSDMSCPAAFDELYCSDAWICYSYICD